MNTWKTTGLIMALIGAASIAQAQGPDGQRPSREDMIKKYDKDGDGTLNEEERSAMREDMKGKRGGKGGDKGSGEETGEPESEEGRGGPGGERPSAEEIIKKYDTDGSGELSATEFETLMKDQRERMQDRRGGQQGGRSGGEASQGRGGQRGQGGERMSREDIMAKYDADGDGQLSDEERNALRADMKKGQGK